ncbi:MAG TPA: TIGR04283 family arsenosugar biosynthesis glycosyltransferase [Candidatus Binatia bacterium]
MAETISVIIPALNEEGQIEITLRSLEELDVGEVIVVDGGSRDRTRDTAMGAGANFLVSPPGRARQMNRGAGVARGDVLVFLHADTRLPLSAAANIRSALQDPQCVGGRFDVRLDGERWAFKMIEFMINLRSRLSRVATGDQAIFVRRRVFERMGGFPDVPLMEDLAFSKRLKKEGRVACLRTRVSTSSRRWERDGVWRTVFKMWLLRALFVAGVSPNFLKRFYKNVR